MCSVKDIADWNITPKYLYEWLWLWLCLPVLLLAEFKGGENNYSNVLYVYSLNIVSITCRDSYTFVAFFSFYISAADKLHF